MFEGSIETISMQISMQAGCLNFTPQAVYKILVSIHSVGLLPYLEQISGFKVMKRAMNSGSIATHVCADHTLVHFSIQAGYQGQLALVLEYKENMQKNFEGIKPFHFLV